MERVAAGLEVGSLPAKDLKPEKFQDRVRQTILLEIDPDELSEAQLDILIDHLRKRALGDDPMAIEVARKRRS